MNWNFRDDAPIYAQLMEGFKGMIASGELRPGERLKPVRELALEAGVNPNTMQRAFSELEREGLLYTQRTTGRYVTEDASVIQAAKKELAEERLRAFLGSMRLLGYTKGEILSLIEESEET